MLSKMKNVEESDINFITMSYMFLSVSEQYELCLLKVFWHNPPLFYQFEMHF